MLATTEPLGLQRSAVRPLSEGLRGYLMNLYSSVVLNLYAVILYFSLSLSFLTFHRVKSNKSARHRQNKAQQPFARAVLASTRSAVVCRSNLFVSVQALRDLCGLALLRKNITLSHFKQFLACSWTSTASHSICLAKLLLLGIVQVNLALLSLTRNFLTVPVFLWTLPLLMENAIIVFCKLLWNVQNAKNEVVRNKKFGKMFIM